MIYQQGADVSNTMSLSQMGILNSALLFEKIGVGDIGPNDRVSLQELLPADLQAITAVMSIRDNINPKPFSFEVPSDTVLVGIRLQGTCVITSRRWGTSHLIQPGDIYLFADGAYDAIFGKRQSRTMFILVNRHSLVGLEFFQKEHRGHVPITSIDLSNDPISAKVEAIQGCTSKHSYFKYNALLSEVLDKLVEPEDVTLIRFGLPVLDEVFTQLCRQVIESPQLDWTTNSAAEACGYSVYHFSRTFRLKTGLGFHEFVNRVRAIQAVDLICQTGSTCPSVFEQVGLYGIPAATKVIQRELGISVPDIRRVLSPKLAAVAS